MKPYKLLWALLLLPALSACSSKSTDKQSPILTTIDSTVTHRPQSMQVSDITATIAFKGKDYTSHVVRKPDPSLPRVTDEQGDEFIDNAITLTLTCGSKQVINRRFTKKDFAGIVDDRFLRYSLLEGMVYDQATPRGFIYAASVCYPQSDLYVPLRIIVSADGKVNVEREEMMDEAPSTTESDPQ